MRGLLVWGVGFFVGVDFFDSEFLEILDFLSD